MLGLRHVEQSDNGRNSDQMGITPVYPFHLAHLAGWHQPVHINPNFAINSHAAFKVPWFPVSPDSGLCGIKTLTPHQLNRSTY